MKKINILVIGALSRNGLAVAYSLSKSGFNVYGVDELPTTRFSKWIGDKNKPKSYKKIIYFSPETFKDYQKIKDELQKIIDEVSINVLIPTGTGMTILVSKLKESLSKITLVPVEDYEKIMVFHDKFTTTKLAEKLGVPYPKTILVKNEPELLKISPSLTFPVVLKTRKGAGADGVWYANNIEELHCLYKELESSNKNSPDKEVIDKTMPMIQEFIPGEHHDVTAFCVNGEAKCLLTQKRLVTLPLSGGGGIVNITTSDKHLKDYAKLFIKEMKWSGILEFDFKIDTKTGTPKLLEINPKIWGTTWLTISAGFDFPRYLVCDALGEKYTIPGKYTVGLMGRWPILEIKTWFEKPLNLSEFLNRIKSFLMFFKHCPVVYDPSFNDKKFLIGKIFLNILRKFRI